MTFSTANSYPLDQRTTASGISIRCSFGSVTVSERVPPGRMGRSPESRQPVQRKVSDGALSLEQASMVRDGAIHREAEVGTN